MLFGAAYFAAAYAGLQLASLHGNVSPFWPASGLATAVILLGGRRFVPGIVLAAFAINVSTPISAMAALGIAVGNTLEAIVAVWLQKRCAPWSRPGPFAEMVAWICAASGAPLIAASIGVAMLWAGGGVSPGSRPALGLTWWAGDGIGILVVAPALVAVWNTRRAWSRPRIRAILAGAGLAIVATAVAGWVFWSPDGFSWLFLLFPVLLLAAAFFGGKGAKLACLGFVVAGVFGLRPDNSIFGGASPNAERLGLEAFLFAMAVISLFLGVLVEVGIRRLSYAVLLLGWAVSGWIFWTIDHDRQRLDAFRFEGLIDDVQDAIRQRMNTYIDALRGGVSLFAASQSVERDEWRRYSETLQLADRYPGINGVGVIFPVRENELDAFIRRIRADGAPDFAIHAVPDAPRWTADPAGWKYFIITYCEPQATNAGALGLDVASERNRVTAARISRDYGEPRITAPIQRMQNGVRRLGFLLYVPIYAPDRPHDTVQSRRTNFIGWVYAPFVTETFLRGVLGHRTEKVELTMFDGLSVSPRDRIFTTEKSAPTRFEKKTVLQLAGQQFTCVWNRGAAFEYKAGDPLLNAITLAILPALLAGLVMSLQTSRAQALVIAEELTHDLREAKQEATEARAQAEAANAAKSEFLATMSHEIRTPMNGVLGYADLLAEARLPEEERGWVEIIRNSGRSLLTIINDILDFSKIEAGMLELESIPFDIEACAREVVEIMHSQARQRGLTLAVDCQSRLPERVLGDPTRLRQILLNLVSNALKFTEKGSVRIALMWVRSHGRGMLHVAVSDTGIGIPVDRRDRLFHRFSQVDTSTTRRFGGTGLGLAICRHLVELMGGTINVESMVGEGTTIGFDVFLEPLDRNGDAAASDSPQTAACKSGLRVLLAEDVVTNQKLATTVLQRLGCKVEIAGNGREAVDKALSAKFDLIYMDCQMPEMDGFEAAEEIRRREPNRVPIVALTAAASESDRQKCLAAGMDDYITKPFARADFIRTLNRWSKA